MQPKVNQIFLGKAGSHSYGTNTATSDEDFRGIFVAEPQFIRTPFYKVNQITDTSAQDTLSYELNKFMQLYTECNPNIVELLWIDEGDIVLNSPAYELLRKHRKDLMCSRVAFTFSGYAVSQLKQMKNQSKWANNPQSVEPPRQTDFVSLVVNYTDDKVFKVDITEYQENHRLVHYGGNIYGVYQVNGYRTFTDKFHLNTNSEEFDHTTETGERRIPLFIVKFNITEYKSALETWKKYWDWRTLKDKKVDLYSLIENELAERNSVVREITNVKYNIDDVVSHDDMSGLVQTMQRDNLMELLHLCKRHHDFNHTSVDRKHGMHLVRLLRMGEEILTTGQVNVKRPDAQELLSIRNGAWSYEQLVEYGEATDKHIREVLYPKTSLPKKPNIELASELILKIQDMVW